MRPMSLRPWLALSAVVLALGCNTASNRADHDSAASAPKPEASVTTGAPVAAPPTASAAAPQAASTNDLTGSWEGHYEAKRGSVSLPPKVKDKGIAADDGKNAAGPGQVEIAVLSGGDIRGKVSGALGALGISGRVDGATIRAAVRPDDPPGPNPMSGIFLADRKGDVLACELHLAGPDGTVIREASFELKRRK